MKLTAKSKDGAYKQLQAMYIEQGNSGNYVLADKLHNLAQDVLFDDYLTIANIRHRFNKIVK